MDDKQTMLKDLDKNTRKKQKNIKNEQKLPQCSSLTSRRLILQVPLQISRNSEKKRKKQSSFLSNQKMNTKNNFYKKVLSLDKSCERGQTQKTLMVHSKMYIEGENNSTQQKEIETIKNKKQQNKLFQTQKTIQQIPPTKSQFSSKRQDQLINLRKQSIRQRQRVMMKKTFMDSTFAILPGLQTHCKSKSTFYPSKKLQFQTLSIFQQTVKVSKGFHSHKYYPKNKKHEPAQLQITKAHISKGYQKRKGYLSHEKNIQTHKIRRKMPLIIFNTVVQQKNYNKKLIGNKSRGQIKGWDTLDEQNIY